MFLALLDGVGHLDVFGPVLLIDQRSWLSSLVQLPILLSAGFFAACLVSLCGVFCNFIFLRSISLCLCVLIFCYGYKYEVRIMCVSVCVFFSLRLCVRGRRYSSGAAVVSLRVLVGSEPVLFLTAVPTCGTHVCVGLWGVLYARR